MSATAIMDAPADAANRTQLERLQGTWISIAGRREVELHIAGRHFTARFLDGELYMGTFDLLPSGSPRRMNMHIDEGPPKHHGKTAHCIYALDGDLLQWCPASPDSDEVLAAFPPMTDRRYLCTILRRAAKRQPKDE
jgi:uncharacterized protein (TIGR03067 family)